MSTASEMLGISIMGYNGVPAKDPKKEQVAFETGQQIVELLKCNLTPRKIITRQSLENAITGVAMAGGWTNAVLHLPAIAREAGVPLTIDDFGHTSAPRLPCSPNSSPAVSLSRPTCMPTAGWQWSRNDYSTLVSCTLTPSR